MKVNQTNRSHRIAYMVVLLVFAVALTTALVLAAERPDSPEKQTPIPQQSNSLLLHQFTGSPAQC
jgi:hypothetical protein